MSGLAMTAGALTVRPFLAQAQSGSAGISGEGSEGSHLIASGSCTRGHAGADL